MFLNVINYFSGIFGYIWVIDNSPLDTVQEDVMDDEDWDDLDNDNIRYKLQKLRQD